MILFAALAALAVSAVAQPSNEETTAIRKANNDFAMDLYQAVRSELSGNLAASPLSATAALAMLWAGARDVAAAELQKLLHMPANTDVPRTLAALGNVMDALQNSKNVTACVANRLFIARKYPVKESFRQLVKEKLHAGAEEVDFPEEGRSIINRWVEESTAGKIKNFFAENDLDRRTVTVLVNALYFKGDWEKAFPMKKTKLAPFYVAANKTVQAQMMEMSAYLAHTKNRNLSATIVELPYKDDSARMLIVLPAAVDGLEHLEEKIVEVGVDQLLRAKRHRFVNIHMPKFHIASSLQLRDILQRKLGVQRIFQFTKDLDGITDDEIAVDKVLQKTFVEVTETGTVAAATTGVEMINRSGMDIKKVFKADHPFLFLIVSGETIIFMGRVSNPVE